MTLLSDAELGLRSPCSGLAKGGMRPRLGHVAVRAPSATWRHTPHGPNLLRGRHGVKVGKVSPKK